MLPSFCIVCFTPCDYSDSVLQKPIDVPMNVYGKDVIAQMNASCCFSCQEIFNNGVFPTNEEKQFYNHFEDVLHLPLKMENSIFEFCGYDRESENNYIAYGYSLGNNGDWCINLDSDIASCWVSNLDADKLINVTDNLLFMEGYYTIDGLMFFKGFTWEGNHYHDAKGKVWFSSNVVTAIVKSLQLADLDVKSVDKTLINGTIHFALPINFKQVFII